MADNSLVQRTGTARSNQGTIPNLLARMGAPQTSTGEGLNSPLSFLGNMLGQSKAEKKLKFDASKIMADPKLLKTMQTPAAQEWYKQKFGHDIGPYLPPTGEPTFEEIQDKAKAGIFQQQLEQIPPAGQTLGVYPDVVKKYLGLPAGEPSPQPEPAPAVKPEKTLSTKEQVQQQLLSKYGAEGMSRLFGWIKTPEAPKDVSTPARTTADIETQRQVQGKRIVEKPATAPRPDKDERLLARRKAMNDTQLEAHFTMIYPDEDAEDMVKLFRTMTGQIKPPTEAPGFIDRLRNAWAALTGETTPGADFAPDGEVPLPEGLDEETIQFNMQTHGVSREEVIQRYIQSLGG